MVVFPVMHLHAATLHSLGVSIAAYLGASPGERILIQGLQTAVVNSLVHGRSFRDCYIFTRSYWQRDHVHFVLWVALLGWCIGIIAHDNEVFDYDSCWNANVGEYHSVLHQNHVCHPLCRIVIC